jgi:hypothetical protein
VQKERAAAPGAHAIKRALAVPEREQRDGKQHERVQQDRRSPHALGSDRRKHRHAGSRIVVAPRRRQAPEVRRRPQEQHHCERDRHRLRCRIHGCGSGEHCETSRESADDDVPATRSFEPHRVDEPVGEGAEKDIGRRCRASDRGGERHRGKKQEREADQPDQARLKQAGGKRTRLRPSHPPVEVAFIIVIERACRPRCAEHGQRQGRDLPCCQARAGGRCHAGHRARRDRDSDSQFQQRARQTRSGQHHAPPLDRLTGTARAPRDISS